MIENHRSKRINGLQRRISDLKLKTVLGKADRHIKEQNNHLFQRNLGTMNINKDDYAYDAEQWSTLWNYHKLVKSMHM